MSEDCIYFTQNPNEIRKEFKNAKYHDAFSVLKKQRLHYPKNVIFGRRNINSLQNTFDSIAELIQGNVDISLINENKLGESFPSNQFATGYKLIQKIRKKFDGEIVFLLMINCQTDILILTIEVTIRKNKIFVAGIYKPSNLVKTILLPILKLS